MTALTRIAALDQYRGLMLFLLLAANFVTIFSFTPASIKHAEDYGTWHLIDLGAPLFFFAMGLSLGLVLDRPRPEPGPGRTIRRFLLRGALLIAVGTIGVTWLQHHHPLDDWSVLQTIGSTGLVALPFAFLPVRWQWVAGLGLIVFYQVIAQAGYSDWIKMHDVGGLGGPLGSLAWGGVMLCGTTLGGSLGNDWPRFRLGASIMSLSAIGGSFLLSQAQALDKRLATLPYLLLTIGLGATLILALAAAHRRWQTNFWLLRILGANSLVIFILQGLVILVLARFLPQSLSLWVYVTIGILMYAACIGLGALLYRRNIFIRL